MICAFILEKYIKFFWMPISLDLRLFQLVHFQYFRNHTAEHPTPTVFLLFAVVESQSIHDLGGF